MKLTRREQLKLLAYGPLAFLAHSLLPGGKGSAFAQRGRQDPHRKLRTRLTKTYELKYPIVGAGMGFYALPELVAAITNGGGLGVIGAAPEPPFRVQQLIRETKALTGGLFGVDFVNTTLFGAGIPSVTDDHIDVCIQEGVKIVVFFWNPPERSWVERLHASGAEVWMQVGSVAGARAAIDVGCDLLIGQGAESGGHLRGHHEGTPLPRSELIPRLHRVARGRIVLGAGGIANGMGLAQTLDEQAEGAWVGTRFATATESYAHDEYKRRAVAARSSDTVVTTMFGPEWPGVTTRALRNRVVNEWAGRESQIPTPPPPPPVIGQTVFAGGPYPMPKFSSMLPTRDTTGDFEEMWFTVGSTSVGLIDNVKPAAEIMEEMTAEAIEIRRLCGKHDED